MNKFTCILAIICIIRTNEAVVASVFGAAVDVFGSYQGGKFCWKDTYGRGVGTIPKKCNSGEVNRAGLCYPKCRNGYHDSGPLCLKDCRSGYQNHPLSCYKNLFNFYFKESYGRGAGKIPKGCGQGKENKAGLCYPLCRSGYTGIGPVCWKQCGGSTPVNCGAACASSKGACASGVLDQVASVLEVAENVALFVTTAGIANVAKMGAKTAMKVLYKAAQEAIKKGATKADFIKLTKELAKKEGTTVAEGTAGKVYTEALSKKPFDLAWSDLSFLDPTGITGVVLAFTKEIC